MLLTLVFLWIFSTSSHVSPHQPPVDRSRLTGLTSNSTNQRVQIFRGLGPVETSLQNSHEHAYDPSDHHHHDHDGHKVHKLNKLNIQDFITQRDLEKHRRKDATWKTYFAEILAALILVCVMVVFLCWWNWSKRSRQRQNNRHTGGTGPGRQKGRMNRQHTMPELYMNTNPGAPKPPYVGSPEEENQKATHARFSDNDSIDACVSAPTNV